MSAEVDGNAAAAAEATSTAVATLASACAVFLGAALEAAERTSQPPAAVVTVRLSDVIVAATEGNVGHADARAVHCVTVDVLGACVVALPNDAPALSRALTNGACAREWASRLWRSGAAKLQARIIDATEACVHSWVYLFADEEQNADENSRWTLPLVREAESIPLSAELLGNCGFQLVLELRSQTAPPCAALERVLAQLVRTSFLLAPSADLSFEVERASAADAGSLPAQPLTNISVLAACRSRLGAGSRLERLKQASAAHLTASTAAATYAQEGAEQPVGAVSDVGNTVQAAGYAELTTGTSDKRVTWTVTAVVASTVDEPREDGDADVHGCAEAPLFCFANSVLLLSPPTAVLDVLRAKVTATEWKAAFGLRLTGCALDTEQTGLDGAPPASQFSSCASLRFGKSDTPTVRPGLVTLHRACLPPLSLGTKVPPRLGRKREAALVKSALAAALREFKAVTGGGGRSERVMRKHGLPAIAAAVAAVVAAGGVELQGCGVALSDRRRVAPDPEVPADDAQARVLENAVLTSLLDVLAGDLAADLPAPDAEPEAQVPFCEEAACMELNLGGRERSRDISQSDD